MKEKLERYTKVEIDTDVYIYIKNKFLYKYMIYEENAWIVDGNTGEKMKEVSLYQQLYDENGNSLEIPISDEDNYYFLYGDGRIEQCREVYGYEVRL